MRYIKLQHRLVHAQYDEPSGKWQLRVRRPLPGTDSGTDGDVEFEEFTDSADILFTGTGSLSRWKWPEIEGLRDFKGKLFHTADFEVGDSTWQDAVKSWSDKKVGVIGVVCDDTRGCTHSSECLYVIFRAPAHCKSSRLFNRKLER